MVYTSLLFMLGPLIMSVMAQSYHIPSPKRYLKRLSRRCPSCQRAFARTTQQQMGELPADRTRPSKPFSVLGIYFAGPFIDFAGPFSYKERNTRKPTLKKGYISVYVCFCTKAVYFDLASYLSTEAFIASLRRFVSYLWNATCT